MKLTQKQPCRSIVNLPEARLPQFTIITGVNGAGKTHLMNAIVAGNIHVDIARDHQHDVRYFDWTTLVPNKSELVVGHSLIDERSQIWRQLSERREPYRERVLSWARSSGFPPHFLTDFDRLASITLSDCENHFSHIMGDVRFNQLNEQIAQASTEIAARIVAKVSGSQWANAIHRSDPRSLTCLNEEEFYDVLPIGWQPMAPFQQSFGRLFVAYRQKLFENALRHIGAQNGDTQAKPLSKAEFEEAFGVPPWDFVNSTLERAQIDFAIDHPLLYQDAPYIPKLTKKSSGAQVLFDGLSSGEKVLMSFALCMYYSQERRQISQYPRLLLFDEIDAPLHPSMIQTLLSAIMDVLVEKHGIHVILATHSASTVALAPEDSIHVMKADKPGVHKVSKDEAIAVLTLGVPTLAISYDGRRQVFVESEYDAELYSALYELLKPQLHSLRSLTFIATGHDKNGGCERVKMFVRQLRDAGSRSAFGVIDWDKHNKKDSNVFVLSEEFRYSLENLIFDPAIVAALVARDARAKCEMLGWDPNRSHIEMARMEQSQLQSIVQAVERSLGFVGSGQRVKNKYQCGLEVDVLVEYNTYQGHQLETAVLTAFPELNRLKKHELDLKRHVIQNVLRDVTQLVPCDIVDLFNALLTA